MVNLINIALLILSSISLVHSAAFPLSSPPITETLTKRNGGCGNLSSFSNTTSATSPLLKDCQALYQHWNATNTDWQINPSPPNVYPFKLVQGTCKFTARTSNAAGSYFGNGDAAWNMGESIRRFAKNGRVGAEGESLCWIQ